MNAPTKYQIINHNDQPAFVLVPIEEYEAIRPLLEKNNDNIPHEVVGAYIMQGDSLIKAWREYRNMTQAELAEKCGMKQPAIARLESSDSTPQRSTLRKLATAMGITLEQLLV
jgi:ribosome-binding protein aMBF1 (putative translation factor)